MKRVGLYQMPLPEYQTSGAAAFDLRAAIGEVPVTLLPRAVRIIPTGIAMQIPVGYEGCLRGRSSLGAKGIGLANGVGTIDSDFRGEVGIVLVNFLDEVFRIEHLDRIAQMVIAPMARAELVWGELEPTERGSGGYGSTGT